MVKAWIADVTPLCREECYERYYHMVPEFRREKADRLKHPGMKAQSVGVWFLWQKIRERYGLPEDCSFNLSHSGTLVMCAAEVEGSRARVGCDIEKTGKLRLNIAEHYFCPEEYATIVREPSEEAQTEMFYRYWVLKESFMKATRKGMALPADRFCIQMGRQGKPPVLIRQPEEFPEEYHYCEYTVPGLAYRMAVCTTDGRIDRELHVEQL